MVSGLAPGPPTPDELASPTPLARFRCSASAIRWLTGEAEIPVLVAPGEIVRGEQTILAYLDEHFIEPPDAAEQRAQAAKAKQKELEAACPKLAAATR